jgi:hypothetical protein
VITQLISVVGGDEAAAEASLIDEALLVRGSHRKLPRNHSGVVVDGDPDLYTKLAKCCMPVPGRPDHRLRHARGGHLGAPHRLHQRRVPAADARADGPGLVGARR